MNKILRNKTFIVIISGTLFLILFAGMFLLTIGFQKAWCDDHNGKYIFGFNKGGYCIYE